MAMQYKYPNSSPTSNSNMPEGVPLEVIDYKNNDNGPSITYEHHVVRTKFWATLSVLLILCLFTLLWSVISLSRQVDENSNAGIIEFPETAIALEDYDGSNVSLGQLGQVTVNGVLKVNGSVVLDPSQVPENPNSGEMYYDNQTDSVYYYNGSDFKEVATVDSTVNSISGATGDLATGRGLAVTGNTLVNTITISSNSSNIGVVESTAGNYTLSFSSGAVANTVNLAPAIVQTDNTNNPSIYINKTNSGGLLRLSFAGTDRFRVDDSGNISVGTIPYSSVVGRPTNTVESLGGASGTITLGSGLNMVGNVLSATGSGAGISAVNGTSSQVNVTTIAGVATVSLPQNIATNSAPTFSTVPSPYLVLILPVLYKLMVQAC